MLIILFFFYFLPYFIYKWTTLSVKLFHPHLLSLIHFYLYIYYCSFFLLFLKNFNISSSSFVFFFFSSITLTFRVLISTPSIHAFLRSHSHFHSLHNKKKWVGERWMGGSVHQLLLWTKKKKKKKKKKKSNNNKK